VKDPRQLQQNNIVLGHCRTGANRHGRVFAVLYDLSGLGPNRMNEVKEDWLALQKEMRITADPSYLRHRGKPLVTVWGVGFNDHRQYTLAECRELVEFLNRNGCTVMLGVPTYWRELKKDTVADPALHDLLKLADVISPWTVGRYHSPEQAKMHARTVLTKDLAWCREQKLDYLPVIFPGFSWRNMHGGELNAVPRLKGEFFWSQFAGARQAGAQMIYVAMFDEVDEGTAIFKCTNDVPDSGDTKFVTYEGLPSDFYLRLAGMAAGMLNGKLPFRVELPLRKP
jgi:hypothetical protein